MAAEAARVMEFPVGAFYGNTAPAQVPAPDIAQEQENTRPAREYSPSKKQADAIQGVRGVSLFAVFGTLLVGCMLVFVMLAQIGFSEIAGETARMNEQYQVLSEQQRKLRVEFENVIDIKEVEAYARNYLGMSKPGEDQIVIIGNQTEDSAEIIPAPGDEGVLAGIGEFISSLLQRFQ